jgi:hypothetical protein
MAALDRRTMIGSLVALPACTGLSHMPAGSSGSYAYATQPGEPAFDMINSRGSPYGQAFSDAIMGDEPTLDALLRKIALETRKLTGDVQKPAWTGGADFSLAGLWKSAPALLLVFTDYVGSSIWAPLRGAEVDASFIAEALGDAGANVLFGVNLVAEEVDEILAEFAARSRSAPFALLYSTGHGVTIGGNQYIIPLDLHADDQEGVRGAYVWRKVSSANQADRFLSVWAGCRDNPRAWTAPKERQRVADDLTDINV